MYSDIIELLLFYYSGLLFGSMVQVFKPKTKNKYIQIMITSTINVLFIILATIYHTTFIDKVKNSVSGILFITTYFYVQKLY